MQNYVLNSSNVKIGCTFAGAVLAAGTSFDGLPLGLVGGELVVKTSATAGGGGDATAANQATEIARLTSILAKILTAPSTEAKQDTGNTSLSTIAAKDFATQTTLAAVLAKIIVAPATAAKQDALLAGITQVGAVVVAGISEVDNYTTGATSNHTVAAGAIAIAINFSSDFTGTVQGATYTAANQGVALSRVAQPGNLLPALAVTRSAGSYDYYVVTPT